MTEAGATPASPGENDGLIPLSAPKEGAPILRPPAEIIDYEAPPGRGL